MRILSGWLENNWGAHIESAKSVSETRDQDRTKVFRGIR